MNNVDKITKIKFKNNQLIIQYDSKIVKFKGDTIKDCLKKIVKERHPKKYKISKSKLLEKFNYALGMKRQIINVNGKKKMIYNYSFVVNKHELVTIRLTQNNVKYLKKIGKEREIGYMQFYKLDHKKKNINQNYTSSTTKMNNFESVDNKRNTINSNISISNIKKSEKKLIKKFIPNVKYENLDDKLYTICYTKMYEGRESRYNIQDKEDNNIVNLVEYCKSKKYNSYYERLKKNVKLYFDIERKLSIDKWSTKELRNKYEKYILKTFINDLKKVMKKYCKENIDESQIYITRASRLVEENKKKYWKISFHIVGPSHLYFESNHKLNKLESDKTFVSVNSPYVVSQILKDMRPKFYNEIIDESVYSTGRMMRMINSYKGKGNNKLIAIDKNLNILETDNITNYIISHKDYYQKSIKFSDATIKKFRILSMKKMDKIRKDQIATREYLKKNNISHSDLELKVIKKMKMYGDFNKYHEGRECFYFRKNNRCCVSGRKECTSDYAVTIDKYGQVIMRCVSNNCTNNLNHYTVRNLGYLEDTEAEFENKISVHTKYLLDLDKKTNELILDFKDNEDKTTDQYKIKTLLNQFLKINNIPEEELKVLLIKSGVGTGKTATTETILKRLIHKIMKYLNSLIDTIEEETNEEVRILIVTYRVSLANYIIDKFKKYKFELYSDVLRKKKKLNSVPRLVVQLESLWKIFNDNPVVDTYHIIILDEIESLCAQFNSPYIKNQVNTFNNFYDLLKCARKIIALDANIGSRTKELFSEFKTAIIENTFITVKRNIEMLYIYPPHEYIKNVAIRENQIIQDLKNGNKLIIIVLSSKYGKILMTKLEELEDTKNLKGLDIFSESTDKKKKLNPKDFKDYDYIIYSPCIEAGVDINYNYFNRIYLFINPGSTHQRGLHQMIGRCRQVSDTTIRCVVNSRFMPRYTSKTFFTYAEMKEYYQFMNVFYDKHYKKVKGDLNNKLITDNIELFNKSVPKKKIIDTKNNKIYYKPKLDKYHKICIHNLVELFNKSPDIYLAKMYSLFDKMGYTFKDIYSQENLNNVKDVLKDKENIDMIGGISVIDENMSLCDILGIKESDLKIEESKDKNNKKSFRFPTDEKNYLLNTLSSNEHIEELEKKKKKTEPLTSDDKEDLRYYYKYNKTLGLIKDLPEHHEKKKYKEGRRTKYKYSLKEQIYKEIIKNKRDFLAVNLRNYLLFESSKDYYNEKEIQKKRYEAHEHGIYFKESNYKKFTKNTFIQFKCIKDILNILGCKSISEIGCIKFNRELMENKMEKILKESHYYKNFKNTKKICGSYRSKKPTTFRTFVYQLTSLLNTIGLSFINTNKNKPLYKININSSVATVLRWKKNAGQKIKGYDLIEDYIENITDQNSLYLEGHQYTSLINHSIRHEKEDLYELCDNEQERAEYRSRILSKEIREKNKNLDKDKSQEKKSILNEDIDDPKTRVAEEDDCEF